MSEIQKSLETENWSNLRNTFSSQDPGDLGENSHLIDFNLRRIAHRLYLAKDYLVREPVSQVRDEFKLDAIRALITDIYMAANTLMKMSTEVTKETLDTFKVPQLASMRNVLATQYSNSVRFLAVEDFCANLLDSLLELYSPFSIGTGYFIAGKLVTESK